jgi:membrane-associated phospholipid phosphatase
MSTMFLKQHSAVDVVCGLILSVVLDLLVRRWNPGLGLLRLVVRPRAGGRTVMEA